MSYLEVQGLELRFKEFSLRPITFSVQKGETFVVLGPSGSGKSVLLETIAGFYTPSAGAIRLAGRDVTQLPPEERQVGFMFQDYALFPHKSVGENVRFGLRYGRVRDGRTKQIMEMLGISHLEHRRPASLSGGEKQRVALARALVTEPQLFLFDEPMSALDARARDTLREELKGLLRELGITAVYVTHDQTEALVLADRIAVLRDGQLVQVGVPADIFNSPADEFVANFVGVETILPGTVVACEDGLCKVSVAGGELQVAKELQIDRQVLVCIRPEEVTISEANEELTSARNRLRSTVRSISQLGPIFKVRLDCGFPLVAFVTKHSYLELNLKEGKEVLASIKATAIHLIPR